MSCTCCPVCRDFFRLTNVEVENRAFVMQQLQLDSTTNRQRAAASDTPESRAAVHAAIDGWITAAASAGRLVHAGMATSKPTGAAAR